MHRYMFYGNALALTVEPFQPGWVMTVEPAIYIREEGFAVRLENDILVQEDGNMDLEPCL